MTYQEAKDLMQSVLKDPVLQKHSLASGEVLKAMAGKLGEDQELWGVAGLLHDLDFEETADDPDNHGLKTVEMLEGKGLPQEMLTAIKAHNAEYTKVERSSKLDLALTAGETITGLVVATTLVYPDKKLASVKPKSVTKRMKEKAFARNVNRDNIRLCEELGIPVPEFSALAVEAMRQISDELGL
jgi:putative nucleotidyltransferase with HDIG domain